MGHKRVICGSHPDCSVGQWVKWVNKCDPLSTLHPVLGLNDCVQLDLIKRVCHIQEGSLTKESLQERYPTVFTELGKLGTYHITLHDNHQPVINLARRIPQSLKDKLQQTRERNVKSGVLQKGDQPTDWVSII